VVLSLCQNQTSVSRVERLEAGFQHPYEVYEMKTGSMDAQMVNAQMAEAHEEAQRLRRHKWAKMSKHAWETVSV
jgi:hypothetical protein